LAAIKARPEQIRLGGDGAWHVSGACLSARRSRHARKGFQFYWSILKEKLALLRRLPGSTLSLQSKAIKNCAEVQRGIAAIAAPHRDGTVDRISTETS
jgi:hypothetical protein